MAAVFRIKQTFELRSRGMLMIVGDILSGTVHVGDHMSGLGFDLSIAAVEMLDRADRSWAIALGIRYTDGEDLDRMKEAAVAGVELAISGTTEPRQ